MNVALGARDEDILTSLASRIVRLNAQMTPSEWKEFQEITGVSAGQTAQALLDAFDPDVIAAHAGVSLPEGSEPTRNSRRCWTLPSRSLPLPPSRCSTGRRFETTSKMSDGITSKSSTM